MISYYQTVVVQLQSFILSFFYHEGEGQADDIVVGDGDIPSISAINSLDSPMDPCPSAVKYVTHFTYSTAEGHGVIGESKEFMADMEGMSPSPSILSSALPSPS